MRAFRYPLAAALRRAEHREQSLQLDLARVDEQLAAAKRRLDNLQGARAEFHARVRALQHGEVRMDRLLGLRRELEYVDRLLEGAQLVRRQLERRAAALRERLVEAARNRRKFDNHRRDLAGKHRRSELAEETKQIDDLTMTRFARPRQTQEGP